jgi:ferredoxin
MQLKKERVMLLFSAETYGKPITFTLIHEYNLRVNILKAEVTPGEEGHLLIDLEGLEDNIKKAMEYLEIEKVEIVPINQQIKLDQDRCIHCGACTAVCFSQAMVMNRENWQVEFNPNKCVVCGLCVSACPMKIISGGNFELQNGKY